MTLAILCANSKLRIVYLLVDIFVKSQIKLKNYEIMSMFRKRSTYAVTSVKALTYYVRNQTRYASASETVTSSTIYLLQPNVFLFFHCHYCQCSS